MDELNTAVADERPEEAVKPSGFRQKLEEAINGCRMENVSNTPDFILAEYLDDCLLAFDKAVNARSKWYGRSDSPGQAQAF